MMRFLFPALCAALSAYAFSGKATLLLAGRRDSTGLDEKKLRLLGGISFLVLAVFSLLGVLLSLPALVLYIVYAVVCVTSMFLCNTVCQSEKSVPLRERTGGMIFVAVLLASVFCTALFGGTSGPRIEANATTITIRSSVGVSQTIPYENIFDAEYVPKMDAGTRRKGVENARSFEGEYRNDDLSTYRLYAYKSSDFWIVLHTADGTVAVSGQSEDDTRALYATIHERLRTP